MISKYPFIFSWAIGAHHARLMWAASAVTIVAGLSGPKYGAVLAYFALLAARLGIFTGIVIWVVVMLLRKKVPGLHWRDMIPEWGRWQKMGAGRRAAWTTFFSGVAVVFICLGALIGTIFVTIVWRIT